jgi:hypothetical protein
MIDRITGGRSMADTKEDRVRAGNEIVRDQTIILDGGHFVGKSFIDCRLVYEGGLPPVLKECDFIDSEFAFDGAASRTLSFVSALARNGAEDLIKSLVGLR